MNKEWVCAKTFKSSIRGELVHEAKVLSRLCHKNVAWLVGVCSVAEPYVIVTKLHLASGVHLTLHDAVANFRSNQHEKDNASFLKALLVKLLVDVLNAMQYIHSLNLLHNDIKADNVALDGESDNCRAVLIDFGKAQWKNRVFRKRSLAGEALKAFLKAHPHIALEVPSGHAKESFSSDFYSFGVLADLLLRLTNFGHSVY